MTSNVQMISTVGYSLAGGFGLIGCWIRYHEISTRWWPQVTGQILTSRTKRHYLGKGQEELSPDIVYEFTHKNRRIRTGHWRLGNHTPGFREDAEAVIAKYPAGSSVTVFVNRRNPKKSVLAHRVTPLCWIPIAIGFGLLILALLPRLLAR